MKEITLGLLLGIVVGIVVGCSSKIESFSSPHNPITMKEMNPDFDKEMKKYKQRVKDGKIEGGLLTPKGEADKEIQEETNNPKKMNW